MKNYLGPITLSILLLFSSFSRGHEADDVLVALKSGNATQLSRYFDNRVDISLPDKSDNYSKTQAEMILRDFFYNNTVKDFSVRYKSENNGSRYFIGTLLTRNGDYRTKLLMKIKGDKQVLEEIAFQSVQ